MNLYYFNTENEADEFLDRIKDISKKYFFITLKDIQEVYWGAGYNEYADSLDTDEYMETTTNGYNPDYILTLKADESAEKDKWGWVVQLRSATKIQYDSKDGLWKALEFEHRRS